jgi:uncharacterized Zn finger protein (UPF0148 family)
MNCPNCNQKLFQNRYGDLVCPICGIIYYHDEKEDEDYKDYKNYIG